MYNLKERITERWPFSMHPGFAESLIKKRREESIVNNIQEVGRGCDGSSNSGSSNSRSSNNSKTLQLERTACKTRNSLQSTRGGCFRFLRR